VILTSNGKKEQLVNRKKNLYISSKIATFPGNSVEKGWFCWCLNSAALCCSVLAWLQEPRGGAWGCFAGLRVSLGNLKALAAFEKLFCKMHGDSVGHFPETKGQNWHACPSRKTLQHEAESERFVAFIKVFVVLLKFMKPLKSRCCICWGLEV